MPVILAVALFLVLLVTTGGFGYYYYVRPSRLLDQLTNTRQARAPLMEKKPANFGFSHLLKKIGDLLPVSAQDAKAVKHDMIAAGIRTENAIQKFYGIKLLFAAVCLVGALIGREHMAAGFSKTILPVAGAGLGFLLPGFVLNKLINRRNDTIRLALPDVLDLLVVCTEAGCGLDQAIVNVSRELKSVHPAMSEELSLVNMEIMAGTSRAEALRHLAKRCQEEEIKKLVALLVQTDRFGTSISDSLRTQSDYLRIRRRQEAEERAGKVGVKLVFPNFLFLHAFAARRDSWTRRVDSHTRSCFIERREITAALQFWSFAPDKFSRPREIGSPILRRVTAVSHISFVDLKFVEDLKKERPK